MRALIAAGLLALALPLQAAPEARLIESARRSLVDCQLAQPEQSLAPAWLLRLEALQRLARHAQQAQDLASMTELAVLARLRRAEAFEIEDVYAAECRIDVASGLRRALGSMRAADPVVVRDTAWVPLVTAGGEYLGAGLVFERVDGAWRWSGWDNRVLARSAQTHALSLELGAVRAMPDDDDHYRRCIDQLPPAPMPRPEAELLAEEGAVEEPLHDASNALGAAQRQAALRFAEGRGEPPSASAKLILAEILLRSLDFEGAPEFPGERWRQRVQRAEALIADAQRNSVDWQRMAPILSWLARAHESGQGGLSIDPALAMRYRQMALGSANADGLDILRDLESQSWMPAPPGHDLRFEVHVEELRCE